MVPEKTAPVNQDEDVEWDPFRGRDTSSEGEDGAVRIQVVGHVLRIDEGDGYGKWYTSEWGLEFSSVGPAVSQTNFLLPIDPDSGCRGHEL